MSRGPAAGTSSGALVWDPQYGGLSNHHHRGPAGPHPGPGAVNGVPGRGLNARRMPQARPIDACPHPQGPCGRRRRGGAAGGAAAAQGAERRAHCKVGQHAAGAPAAAPQLAPAAYTWKPLSPLTHNGAAPQASRVRKEQAAKERVAAREAALREVRAVERKPAAAAAVQIYPAVPLPCSLQLAVI